MMNPVWLKTFCELVEVGSFTRTAEKLYMTQSGVSQHIQKLEANLEVQLLIRQGKSFSLTVQGKVLYQSGKSILKSLHELETQLKEDCATTGRVTIKSPGSVGLKLYPDLLALQQQFPELIIDYRFSPNREIQHSIINRDIEFGLTTEVTDNDAIRLTPVANEELLLVVAKGIAKPNWQALSKMKIIEHPDFEHHAKMLLAKNFGEFHSIDQFEKGGFSNQIQMILLPVARGLGFTVLPKFAVDAFERQSEIAVWQFKHRVFESIYLAQNKDAKLTNRALFVQSKIKALLANKKG